MDKRIDRDLKQILINITYALQILSRRLRGEDRAELEKIIKELLKGLMR